MKMSLQDCRLKTLDALLDLIWSQWTTMGVSGSIPITENWILDPEALIIITCNIGRYDPRVFDSMLEWIGVHQRFLNVQRLKTLNRMDGFSGGNLLSAIAHLLIKPSSRSKWERMADQLLEGKASGEPLFYLKDGNPHPTPNDTDSAFRKAGFSRHEYRDRKAIVNFRSDYAANLILKLRAIFGVNSRCEIVAYLHTHTEANPTEIANATGYSPKGIYNAITDLYRSRTLTRRIKGRESLYSLKEELWSPLLSSNTKPAKWLNWPEVYRLLNTLWSIIDSLVQDNANESVIASEILLAWKRMLPELEGPVHTISEDFLSTGITPNKGIKPICACINDLVEILKK